MQCSNKGNGDGAEKDHHNAARDTDSLETGSNCSTDDLHGVESIKCPTFQRGVLRTNCIDCLDRTNVAQYVYGLVAIGHQLHALGFIDVEHIDLDSPLADALMKIYEAMGDTLALQYGGSAAHNKVNVHDLQLVIPYFIGAVSTLIFVYLNPIAEVLFPDVQLSS